MEVHDIPAFNAMMNAIATLFIVAGLVSIKLRKERLHRALMVAALLASVVFLVGYVYHKAVLGAVNTPFTGEGAIRAVYYPMLITHIILAAFIVPLVAITVVLAIRNQRQLHRKWARVTYPIWLYVSVTGVLVYQFLYVWYPSSPPLPE